ncbi:MAG: penicillin-binding protein, partial [Bacteroidetes bacterium]|nr:penicillin-binding protein [Bacteroidota bacterium]
QVPQGGTATRMRTRYGIPFPVGGKTGTTQDNSDGWFMGVSPDLVAGCWVGCEDRKVHFRSTTYGQGANTALPIFGLFMKKVLDNPEIKISRKDFVRPDIDFTIEVDCAIYDQQNPRGNNHTGDGIPGIDF